MHSFSASQTRAIFARIIFNQNYKSECVKEYKLKKGIFCHAAQKLPPNRKTSAFLLLIKEPTIF